MGAAIGGVLLAARQLSIIVTDMWWFSAAGQDGTWWTYLQAKVVPTAVAGVAAGAFVWWNLRLTRSREPHQHAPMTSSSRPQTVGGEVDQFSATAAALLAPWLPLVRVGLAALVGLTSAASVAGRWEQVLLFLNRQSFGTTDPLFGRDIGFYMFELPVYGSFLGLVQALFAVTLVLVVAGHMIAGRIRVEARPRVSTGAKAHLSVLLALLAVVRAGTYFLDRYELTTSGGLVTGAGHTDVHARIPALGVLVLASLTAAVLLALNLRRRGWGLPLAAVSVWALTSLVVGTIYPALVQRFSVEPAESERELALLERNIDATRASLGLDGVSVRPYRYGTDLTSDDLDANADTIRNIRLWDPAVLRSTYQRLQEIRTFYRFNDVDIDRYMIDGELTQVVLSARELNSDRLPRTGWDAQHLAYTHGYGAVMSPANAVTTDGQPDFLVKNMPPEGNPAITQPELYFGENLPGYALVGTGRAEVNFVGEDGTVEETRYGGDGGVDAGSWWRRALFALRFGDVNPLISSFVGPDTEVLFHRDITDRVTTLAPFLSTDSDPYPAVIDGRLLWIVDTYLTSADYPFAQIADTTRLADNSGLDHQFNYVRNSIKATVDAHDGTVTLYVVDPDDPLTRAWQHAVPDLFTPAEAIPADLEAHLRYPEDLFRVQTSMWGRYHIDDPAEFYAGSDAWTVAQDPGTGPLGQPVTTTTTETDESDDDTFTVEHGPERRMDPYHLLMRLPGESHAEFILLQPFVPFSSDDARKELSAFMVARSDPGRYGGLEAFVMPRNIQVDGPAIVDARIQQEPSISREISLLNVEGSRVVQGNLILVPIEQSLLYVRPLYLEAEGTQVPELKSVIVVFGDRVVMRDTLQDALTAIFGDAPPTREDDRPEELPGEPSDTGDESAHRLLAAAEALQRAEQALSNGDLVGFATHYEQARAILADTDPGQDADTASQDDTDTASEEDTDTG